MTIESLDQDRDTHMPARPRRILKGLEQRVRRMGTIALVMIAIGAGVGLDRMVLDFSSADAQNGSELRSAEDFTILEETFNAIRGNYVLSDNVSDQDLIYGASRGMVDALGDDGHSRFLDPEEAQQFIESSRGELTGIGIQVDTRELPLKVIAPLQNSPALEAGILSGDVILAIDGVETSTMASASDAAELIRGDEGTDVTLSIQRVGEPERFDVTITRAKLVIEPVSWAMLPGGVLWVQISQFSSGAGEKLKEALAAGKEAGAVGVVLDLRSNPGGLVSEANNVGLQFQPDGAVLYQEQGADGNAAPVKLSGEAGEWQDGPLVVLVDQYSASASEITASSIGENGRGTVVGETTYGTGTVLLPLQLSDDSMVLIGTELWLTPDGNVIWHQGVAPEIQVSNAEDTRFAMPFLFEGNVMTESQLADSTDQQLATAREEVLKLLDTP